MHHAKAAVKITLSTALNLPQWWCNGLARPIGAISSILIDNMLDKLEIRDKNFGLITMCTT